MRPPPPSPTDEIEHLAQLHASGVLTDEEFSAAKAKALGIVTGSDPQKETLTCSTTAWMGG